MAYESPESLKRRIESLSTPMFSGQAAGLANAIRARRGRKYEEQLSQVEQRNQANRAQELAMLLRGAETGRVGDFAGAATLDQAKFTDPTVQELAAKLRLEKASQKPVGPMVVGRGGSLVDPTGQVLYSNPYTSDSGSSLGTSITWGREGDRYVPFQASTGGGLVRAEVPEGIEMIPGAGIMGYDPNFISGATPAKAGQAGAITGAQEDEKTRAIMERVPIELDKLVQEGAITNEAKVRLENTLTPILVNRAGAEQQTVGDIETQQGIQQAGAQGLVQANIERYQTKLKEAEGAAQTVRMMDQFIEASANAPAGSMQPVVTMVKNFIASTGGNPSGLTDTALAQAAMAGTLVPLIMDSGARLTDSDRQVLERYGPQLATSREAREAVANALKASAIRTLEEFDILESDMRQNPTYQPYLINQPFMQNYRQSRQSTAAAPADNLTPEEQAELQQLRARFGRGQ